MDLVLTHHYFNQPGGGERVILEIAKKFNPIIYCVSYEPTKTFPEFKEFDLRVLPKCVFEVPFFFLRGDVRRFNAISAGFRYYFTKIKDDYDVINAHGSPSEWVRHNNERVSWYCHSPNREAFDLYEWRVKQLPLHKQLFNLGIINVFKVMEFSTVPKLEQILTNSEVTKKRITKYLYRKDATVVHPGVDVKLFTNESYEKYFLYPSRIVPEKRFEYVIQAFRLFSLKTKGWKLVIAGFLPNTLASNQYLEQLKELASGINVEFRLNISDKDLKQLYANCSAVLFSAVNEDWGLVPLEAMSAEKPCISVNEGGPTYSILDTETGFLVNSEVEMSEKMAYLATNMAEVERMGKAGRKRVLKNYTWKSFLAKIQREFAKLAR
jgi:glycosyltransferase involved in cell wall biosynthesis